MAYWLRMLFKIFVLPILVLVAIVGSIYFLGRLTAGARADLRQRGISLCVREVCAEDHRFFAAVGAAPCITEDATRHCGVGGRPYAALLGEESLGIVEYPLASFAYFYGWVSFEGRGLRYDPDPHFTEREGETDWYDLFHSLSLVMAPLALLFFALRLGARYHKMKGKLPPGHRGFVVRFYTSETWGKKNIELESQGLGLLTLGPEELRFEGNTIGGNHAVWSAPHFGYSAEWLGRVRGKGLGHWFCLDSKGERIYLSGENIFKRPTQKIFRSLGGTGH